jgi:hypothetical protein
MDQNAAALLASSRGNRGAIKLHLPSVVLKPVLEFSICFEVHYRPRIVLYESQIDNTFDDSAVRLRKRDGNFPPALATASGFSSSNEQWV